MDKINLANRSYLCFGRGRLDDWCVYEIDFLGFKKAPRDVDYFNDLYRYAKMFESSELYNDYVKIYDLTSKTLDENVVNEIREISVKYGEYSDDIFRIFATIYMGMIAEENKENTKLGKRIKRLGIYYLLVKLETPKYCSDFMKNKSWLEIDRLCLEGGF